MHFQLEYLATCFPGRLQRALNELPSTLDETYDRILQEIGETKWEFARRLLHCVAVANRPLRVEELADVLAFDFNVGQIPKFREDWRLEDPVDAVLSTCSTLLSLVNIQDSQVIQFSHFSVKEFLTSTRFAEKQNTISRRYHISMTPAHTLVAQVCLGILLHLDKDITRSTLPNFPLAEYAAENWFKHARFEGVSQHVEEGILQMFDRRKPHLSVWFWICDPTIPIWKKNKWADVPSMPHGTPLHYAGLCGLYDVVKVLAAEHPQDVNSRSFIGEETPLHLTSRVGHRDVALLLIEHGADPTAQSKDGTTPLHRASEGGHVDVAQLLIEHGADLTAQNNDGTTLLHHASEVGHIDLARLLIEHGADPTAQSKEGTAPLHRASEAGHVDLARFLIEQGADLTAQNNDGTTPLHHASEGGHIDLARLLVENGADLTAQNKDGTTPLHRASEGGHVDLARLLVEHGADAAAQSKGGTTPLHRASQGGHVDLARLLFVYGADVSAQNEDGTTPLHRASEGGHVDLAKFLISHGGADAAAQSNDGTTPLHLASERGHVDLAQFLIEHGADPAARSNDGTTPLHRASFRGHVDVTQLLIEHGADAEALDEHGTTPLHQASERGHVDVAQLLIDVIEHGADVAAQSKDQKTPPHGTDANARDEHMTPLHRASKFGHLKVVRNLLSHSPRADARDEADWTPLHFASQEGHLEVVQLLLDHCEDKGALPMTSKQDHALILF